MRNNVNWYKTAQQDTQKQPWEMSQEEWKEYVKSRSGYQGLPEDVDPTGIFHYPQLKGRHNVNLKKIRKHQFGNKSYDMTVTSPRTPSVKDSIYYRQWDEEKKYPQHKTYDADLINENGEIVDDRYKEPDQVFNRDRTSSEDYMYRGISAPELRNIMSAGYIQSDAHLNFENQQNVTCFADNADQAFSYAGGFAPWYEAPSYEEPGYVLEVKKSPHGVVNRVGEIEVPGRVSNTDINKVYEVKIAEENAGNFDVRADYLNMETGISPLREGSSLGLSQKYLIREVPMEEWGESYYDRAIKRHKSQV